MPNYCCCCCCLSLCSVSGFTLFTVSFSSTSSCCCCWNNYPVVKWSKVKSKSDKFFYTLVFNSLSAFTWKTTRLKKKRKRAKRKQHLTKKQTKSKRNCKDDKQIAESDEKKYSVDVKNIEIKNKMAVKKF